MPISALATTVPARPEEVEAVVRDALAAEGFGVLTEIDVAAVLRAKLGRDRPPLRILGACNPVLAAQALDLDPAAALLLPCNVVIEAVEQGGGPHTLVAAIDPRALLTGKDFEGLAEEAAGRLAAVIRKVTERFAPAPQP